MARGDAFTGYTEDDYQRWDAEHDARHERNGQPKDLRCPCGSGYMAGDCPRCQSEKKAPSEADEGEDIGDLLRTYTELRPAVIEGLLREGETANLVSSSKANKSWTAIALALCVATGHPWLDIFPTIPGRVLIIDNELHKQTITHRVRKTAEAMGIPLDDIIGRVTVRSFRGRLQDIFQMEKYFQAIQPGEYKLVILDALYRTLPRGFDENSNADMAAVYNAIDQYAEHLLASFVPVHHASKGNQSGKSVVDVGSGAGSQSRAVDAHLVLRPHEEEDTVVLEAVVRSFAPVQALCLRWDFPLWRPVDDLDPAALKGRTKEKPTKDDPVKEQARVEANALKLLHALEVNDPENNGVSRDMARSACGLGGSLFGPAVTLLIEQGKLTQTNGTTKGYNGANLPTKLLKRVTK